MKMDLNKELTKAHEEYFGKIQKDTHAEIQKTGAEILKRIIEMYNKDPVFKPINIKYMKKLYELLGKSVLLKNKTLNQEGG